MMKSQKVVIPAQAEIRANEAYKKHRIPLFGEMAIMSASFEHYRIVNFIGFIISLRNES
jgi:hypothetical protein